MGDYLCSRFDDHDEIKDVANYGCSGGVSGFIYYNEINEFFDHYESQIEDIMEMAGITYQDLVPHADNIQTLKQTAVWFVVEDYCQHALNVLEDELVAA
jgi:hypothetical protein